MITADGSDDHLITPEGLENYQVPPPNVYSDPVNSVPSAPVVDGQDGLEEYSSDSDEEEDVNMEDESVLTDDVTDRDSTYGYSGRRLNIHYSGSWCEGVVSYFNRKLLEYKVEFEDGSVDYIPEEDIGSIDVVTL